ncbi:hypothetical protein BGZ65_006519 [Modicella reniformis]|uniref:Uncharacterized protein n=1 Tax=Modicella reniformis TaxID=1440133 RepID=A0A9P6MAZ7_9FUNG|nr:hypothetical protein BGZ65_006519 [Modicella reniformis]
MELEPTISVSIEPPSLPLVCTKLEELKLFIKKPLPQSLETDAMNKEFAIPIILQVGVLCNALKSLKRLNTLELHRL